MNSAVLLAEETVICRSFVQFCANFFGAGANNDVILFFVRGLTCGRDRRLLYPKTIPYRFFFAKRRDALSSWRRLERVHGETPPRVVPIQAHAQPQGWTQAQIEAERRMLMHIGQYHH